MTADDYKKRQHDFDFSWLCPECQNVTKRKIHDNTPVRRINSPPTNISITTNDDSHLDQSIAGDTLQMDTEYHNKTPLTTQENNALDLSQISDLLDKKLHDMQQTIIIQITSSVEEKISEALINIKQELKEEINKVTTTQKKMEEDINKLENDIKMIKGKNEDLQKELQYIKNKLSSSDLNKTTYNSQTQNELDETEKAITIIDNRSEKSYTDANITSGSAKILSEHPDITEKNYINTRNIGKNYDKTIVLYGLNEFTKFETEEELYERIIYAFYDITNIDLTGYIEDVNRIGQRGWRRPIEIELLSKRLKKHILLNIKLFKNTGLWISEFLDEKGRRERKLKKDSYRNKNRVNSNSSQHQIKNYPEKKDNTRYTFFRE